MSFDFGRRRIGVAVGQHVTRSASPVGCAHNLDGVADWARIEAWVAEWQPNLLVVGLPLNTDGTPTELVPEVEAFATDLGRFGLPIAMVDERYSSLEAEEQLRTARARGSRRRVAKEAVDAAAAVVIAERYLATAADE